MEKRVSQMVVRRLPRYFRHLSELSRSGRIRISSRELADIMGVTASQIRQDLNCFGGFGQQGYGYNINSLKNSIAHILGLNEERKTIIIGAGNLGNALGNYVGFEKYGFRLTGIFDTDPTKVGSVINGMAVCKMDDLEICLERLKPSVAMLCVKRDHAVEVAKRLVNAGVPGIWNFSSADLSALDGCTAIENVHLSESLMALSYAIKERQSL